MYPALDKLLFNAATLPLRPFYRRYPFRSPASMRSANDRGMIDLELGFFCSRIPKAANSTIVTNLVRLKLGHDVPSRQAKKIFTHPGRLSRADMARFDDLFKFTVVRNPYSRILSAYLDKIARFPHRRGNDISFAEFLQRLADDRDFLYSNAHWVPQADLLLIPAEEFDFIGKVESLDRDLAEIKQRIRPGISDEITSAGPPPTGAAKKLRHYYSDDALIALVASVYRDDFSTFGYSTEFPA
ncbi:sulfotransferase family protein [Microbulbifer halophilus]|uniref:Sulfotransferase family protein n=1 Tax=Microbulbifer halophilus TaxID=453963 RepID=A0ABW5E930_9GAMM|nr:sulfotransferase family protein [Microbulbifer halophilus]MCW8125425.1 sulfotransferase family protein [Microbulbifer halophilus]